MQPLRNDGENDAVAELEKLRNALRECKHIAELQRIWNGQGWTYSPPNMKRLYELADLALKA
jgi:hypothetical protein